jgi:DNA-binding response OmpR family regulator
MYDARGDRFVELHKVPLDDYVSKPIAPDRLVRLIDAAFSRNRKARSSREAGLR